MGLRITQVDAFTDHPFAGNPAAVCILSAPQDSVLMQHIAKEMNLAETAFLLPQGDGYNLRWFTPAVEVELCGHATLASAHVLWQQGLLQVDQLAKFHTHSGLLTARKNGSWIEMNFPAEKPLPTDTPHDLLDALGLSSTLYVGKNRFDYLIEVGSEEILHNIRPNFAALAQIEARGFIITSRSHSSEYQFASRFFGPRVGVNEDPVTGSAHCCLAPYWCDKLGKNELAGFQASERGGLVRVSLQGNRVLLSGQAVTVMHGELI